MVLTVEDGTGLAAADAYVSEADADAYVAAYQPEGFAAWDAALSAAKEVAIRKATQYLDATYVHRWRGARILPSTQALDWPRRYVYTEGALLSSSVLPVLLVQATVEAAVRMISGDLVVDEAAATTGIASERKKLGPLEKETRYLGTKSTQLRVPKITQLLRPLVLPGNRFPLA